jgi:predicted transcriptional regulator
MTKIKLSVLFAAALAREGTQAIVAKKCGISQSMVSLYISGKCKTVKAANVIKIAKCLRVKPEVLLRACQENDSTVN